MIDLVTAALFFVGTHIGIGATPLRDELIERVGARIYRLLFSLVSLVAIVWLIVAFRAAPLVPLWWGGVVLDALTLLVMPVATLLVVASLTQANPTAIGQAPDPDAPEPARGMLRVTRHPMMWGIGLWAVAHVLANPDLASVVFFGAFAVLAFAGALALDHRLTRQNRPGWGVFVQRTSYVPFAAILEGRQSFVWAEIGWQRVGLALAIYAVLLVAHPWLFGVAALP
jgi:uncharacterized membrane protein